MASEFGATPSEPADPDAPTRASLTPVRPLPAARPPVAPPPVEASAILAEVERARADPSRAFGPYLVLGELGRGGMGVVHRAWDERLRRVVALKVLLADEKGAAAKQAVARFEREAEAVARLRHPNIVSVHEAGEIQGRRYIAMDYVPGSTLDERLRPGKRKLALARAVEAVRDVARAVQYAHEQGVVHRDLKPQNILLGEGDRPYVVDFGLASVRGAGTKLTRTGTGLGTPAYMPPEQASGEKATERSDVYSLGATLYHVLTGTPPFGGMDEINVLVSVLTKDPVPARSQNPRVPRDLETIAQKCLEKEPARRYGTASALADDLDRWLLGESIAARPLGPVARLARRARRNKLATALILLLLAALAAGSAAFVDAYARAREQLVSEARTAARRMREDFEKARAAPVSSDAEAARSDQLLALGLKCLQADGRLAALVPGEAAWRKDAFENALALNEVALAAGQWSLAQAACDEALELRIDEEHDERAKKARDRVAKERTKVQEEHGKTVLAFVDRARKGELAAAENYDEALHALTSMREPQTVRLLGEALDEVTRALASLDERGEPPSKLDRGLDALARLACDALGWLKADAAVAPLSRYLAAEKDQLRAARAAVALCRTGGQDAARAVDQARMRFGQAGVFWTPVERVYGRLGVGRKVGEETAAGLFKSGIAKANSGDRSGAIADYTRSIELDPEAFGPWANRGAQRGKNGDWDGAFADLTRAIELAPGSAEVWIMRGDVRDQRGDPKGAIADYGRAIEIRPTSAAFVSRGIARIHLNDPDGAIDDYGRAIELDPGEASAWDNRGLAWHKKGDEDRALADMTKAIELDPRSPLSYVNRGIVKRCAGDFDGSVADETRAIELDPSDSWAHLQRGVARRAKGDKAGALADLERAVELLPKDADAEWADTWLHRGRARDEAGDAKGAIADYKRFLGIVPDHPMAGEARARIAELEKGK